MSEEKKEEVIVLDPNIIKGVFIDGIGLSFKENEICLDGLFSPPPVPDARDILVARLVFPPTLLLTLKELIEEVIKSYEEKYKKIKKGEMVIAKA